MERKLSLVEPMLEKAKEYGQTSIELFRLKTLDKSSDVLSTILSRLILFIAVVLFLVMLDIALGLWLGELLGKSYYGFMIMTLLYGIVAVVLYFKHQPIKEILNDKIVTLLNN